MDVELSGVHSDPLCCDEAAGRCYTYLGLGIWSVNFTEDGNRGFRYVNMQLASSAKRCMVNDCNNDETNWQALLRHS